MALPFPEARRTGEFLYSGGGYNEIVFDGGWADPTVAMTSGTPLALRKSDTTLVPWDASAVVGSGVEVCVGLLYEPVHVDLTGATVSVRVSYLARGPQAVTTTYGRVPLLGTNTRAELLAALAALGITVRD